MNYGNTNKTRSLFAIAAALLCGAASLHAADTAYTQNIWNNPVNGSWNEDSCWSLGHVPTTSEEAVFPAASANYTVTVSADTSCARIVMDQGSSKQTVTLAGSGKVTCTATDTTNYIRQNRILVLAGASLDLRSQLLNYGGLGVTQGSSYSSSSYTHLWQGSAWITVAGAMTSFSSSSVQSRQAGNRITIESGTFSAPITYYSGSESSANPILTVNGGTLNGNVTLASTSSITVNSGTVNGNLVLSGNATFTMNGGTWTASNAVAGGAVADTVTLNLNGGHMNSAASSGMTDKRWVQGGPDFTFTHHWINSRAANLGAEVEVTSTFEVKGGLASTSATRYTGTGAIIARNLVTVSGGAQTVAVPAIVLGGIADGNPLDTWVDKTDYNLVGPMTIGAKADWVAVRTGNRVPALRLCGDFTVDTTDYYDGTTGRTIILDRANVVGKSTLIVEGAGVLRMSSDKNATPFESVTVKAGATFDPSFGGTGSRGPVQARQFVFENGSHLALTAGNTWLMADSLADSGADIVVTIPSGLAEGWYPVIQGELGGTLPAALVASATIAGDSASWSLVERDGTLFVKKVTAVATGSYDFEWTGDAGTALWSSAANWYGGSVPVYGFTPCFGALGGGTNYYDSSLSVENATRILWLPTADSFTLKMTKPSNKSLTIANANATHTGADSGLYSLASTPQYVDIPIRFAVSLMSWCAAGRGPLVQCAKWISKNSPGQMVVQGDVRYRGNNVASSPVHILRLMDPCLNAPFTRFTVMKGGVMRVSTQIYPIDNGVSTTEYPTPASSIRVDEGGSLSFAGDASQYFGWTRKPAANIIDGTLALECPLAGGVDQTYTGRGTMLVSSVRPQTADSRVTIGGGLTLEAPAWTTVNTTDTSKALALSIEGTAILRATDDFVYGPASGLGDGVAANARALEVPAGAELVVDGNGHVVTFAEDIAGDGCVVLSNGTFVIEGAVAGTLTVAADATLHLDGETSAGAFVFRAGATLAVADGGRISVTTGDIDLTGVKLADCGFPADAWYALASTGNGEIVPDLDVGARFKQKVVTSGSAKTLFVKRASAFTMVVR